MIHLLELDTLQLGQDRYTVGERVSFKDESHAREWLANATLETREYTIYPFLFGIFGGTVRTEKRAVWISKKV